MYIDNYETLQEEDGNTEEEKKNQTKKHDFIIFFPPCNCKINIKNAQIVWDMMEHSRAVH